MKIKNEHRSYYRYAWSTFSAISTLFVTSRHTLETRNQRTQIDAGSRSSTASNTSHGRRSTIRLVQ